MAIQQSKKQSDLEKRLQLLRRQVYGKSNQSSSISYHLSDKEQKNSNNKQITAESYSISDLNFLHQDLLKILIFASCAIGGQVILFLLVKNNVLTLNFF